MHKGINKLHDFTPPLYLTNINRWAPFGVSRKIRKNSEDSDNWEESERREGEDGKREAAVGLPQPLL